MTYTYPDIDATLPWKSEWISQLGEGGWQTFASFEARSDGVSGALTTDTKFVFEHSSGANTTGDQIPGLVTTQDGEGITELIPLPATGLFRVRTTENQAGAARMNITITLSRLPFEPS